MDGACRDDSNQYDCALRSIVLTNALSPDRPVYSFPLFSRSLWPQEAGQMVAISSGATSLRNNCFAY